MDIDNPLVKKRPALNPYYDGVRMISRRLRWDVNYAAWTSRKKLNNLRNNSLGKKAIILCNGPSLNKVDFNLIKSDIFTFGLNKINLLFDRSTFRPNCIVAINPFVIKQNSDFFNSTNILLFLNSTGKRYRWIHSRKKNLVFLYCGDSANGFAKDCSISVNQGFTVTYVALQLAFHMGFKRVALVGRRPHISPPKGTAQ